MPGRGSGRGYSGRVSDQTPSPESAPEPSTQVVPVSEPAIEPAAPAPATDVVPATPATASTAAAPAARTSGTAIAALILSISSWVICPIIPAIIALVLAAQADREVAESNGAVTAAGLTTTAKIVSWVNIGVGAAAVVLGVFMLTVVLAAGGFAAMWG